MQQTFVKTLHGYSLEFNRLLYPVRYQLTVKDNQLKVWIVTVDTNENGFWYLDESGDTPAFLHDLLPDIKLAINQNEQVHAY